MPELHIVGLPGPTRFHDGVASGPTDPRAAALQVVACMRTLLRQGVPVLALPPLERPDFGLLRSCGLTGDDASLLASANERIPRLLRAAMSDPAHATANLATSVPGEDAA